MELLPSAYVADLPVTCMACRVRLLGANERRDHYRTDMHRVNLQRKVAGMPPLTAAEFSLRTEAARAEQEAASARRQPRFCSVCSKKFSSPSALANHNASRRHRDTVRARAPEGQDAASGADGGVAVSVDLSPVESEEDGEDDDAMDFGPVGPDGLTPEQEAEIERRIAEAEPMSAIPQKTT
jgi:Zinc-finger of C2H2 type